MQHWIELGSLLLVSVLQPWQHASVSVSSGLQIRLVHPEAMSMRSTPFDVLVNPEGLFSWCADLLFIISSSQQVQSRGGG
jgi:hypothetical protein